MILPKTKVALTVLGLILMVGGAIAASPSNAEFHPQPNPEPTSPTTPGTGTR